MIKRIALSLAVFLAAGTVRAEDCPGEIPDDAGLRRTLAKKWFSKGETEARAGNDVQALKAYQCSMTFVPHGFTAFNVAQIAERIGDVEVAIEGYRQYLLLVPEAKDAQEVNERVETLKERLVRAREGAASEPPLEALMRKGQEPRSETAVAEPPPAQAVTAPEPDESLWDSWRTSSRRTLAWVALGGGGALALGGVLSNVLARNSMSTCREEYAKGKVDPLACARRGR